MFHTGGGDVIEVQWLELAKLLGVATPLVLFLWRQGEQCHDERVKVQEAHERNLTQQAATYADIIKANAEATLRMADTISQLTLVLKEGFAAMNQKQDGIISTIHNEARLSELASQPIGTQIRRDNT
jgi:hypothetical protein